VSPKKKRQFTIELLSRTGEGSCRYGASQEMARAGFDVLHSGPKGSIIFCWDKAQWERRAHVCEQGAQPIGDETKHANRALWRLYAGNKPKLRDDFVFCASAGPPGPGLGTLDTIVEHKTGLRYLSVSLAWSW